ncbi:MAG: DUF1569 domain-containing protein [Flavobacterium sp.]|uniref:DUF1569 domain-containing protein n=1 Tax=Flavobacterium sp. TaxID=239 RepID=UPI0012220A90|nr:DUF1569 domain-containing protein [Flavobacterium sp.]RZJ68351.1 MAG: DUF1569 domain-containing protein [Flavobacterium sp.]
MENIYYDDDYEQITIRLDKLTINQNRRWGRMTLEQMISHCTIQIKLATGEVTSKEISPKKLYHNRFIQWISLYLIPLPKGLDTPSVMDMETNGVTVDDFATERQHLIDHLEDFRTLVKLHPHPFYGKLSRMFWGRLVWLHIDHHLRQFGA